MCCAHEHPVLHPAAPLARSASGVFTGTPSASGDGVTFTPVMNALAFTMLGLFFLVGLLEAIYAIVGTVMAFKGRRVPLPVIPFLRAPRG